jgi:transcriptional regulator with XRE-family HTH domain
MEASDSVLLQEIDPRVLGSRLRAARLAHGWTQTDLAGELCSVGYVSRLESGQRRPNAAVLESLASRLGIAIDELLRGPTARQQDKLTLALDYAELSLESGDVVEAESRAREARDRALAMPHPDLAARAGFLIARALEQQGSIDDAILELEEIVAADAPSLLVIKAAIALSRCYRESGDFSQAIDCGERLLVRLEGTPLEATDETVQLAVTVAAAHYQRGDTGQAVRICRRAIDKADSLGSPMAKASAYWNASMMEADRGAVRDALPLAERALALLSEGADGRNLVRLRLAVADLQLQLDPPQVEAATTYLDQAERELATTSAGAIDLARAQLIRARAILMAGDYVSARERSAQIVEDVVAVSPDIAAGARTVQGQAAAALGHLDEAMELYRHAVMLLTSTGADRDAAQMWFELAGLLEDIGDMEFARTAYRSAAASVGLRSRPTAAAIDKAAIDRAAIDRAAIDRAAIDQLAIDQLAID